MAPLVVGGVGGVGLGGWVMASAITDSLQTTEVVFGLLLAVAAGVFTIRARSAEIWRQSYEGMKELHEAKAHELIEVRKHLVEAQSKIAVFEQAPRYEDVAAMFQQIADTNTSEHQAMLDSMNRMTLILGHIEERLEGYSK